MAEQGTPLPNRDTILSNETEKKKKKDMPKGLQLGDRFLITSKDLTITTSANSAVTIGYKFSKKPVVKASIKIKL